MHRQINWERKVFSLIINGVGTIGCPYVKKKEKEKGSRKDLLPLTPKKLIRNGT